MKKKPDVMKDLGKVLRHRIIIQKRAVTFDDRKNQIESWSDWKPLRVELNNLFGEEYYAAKTVNEENTVKFTLRYTAELNELNSVDFRISFEGKKYDIKNIDHVKHEGIWLIVRALERGINGGD